MSRTLVLILTLSFLSSTLLSASLVRPWSNVAEAGSTKIDSNGRRHETLTSREPRVLIDVGQEFTFAFDAFLPVGYLQPNGYEVTKLLGTLNSTVLNRYDVLVLEQATTNLGFTADQIDAIKDYVSRGGGLLLVGKGWIWEAIFPTVPLYRYPQNILGKEFGFQFTTDYATKPYSIPPHEITEDMTEFETDAVSGILELSSNATPIIVDALGRPVVAVSSFGNGRVVATAEDVFISSPFTGKPLINQLFVKNLFNWLTLGMAAQNTDTIVPYRILPENLVQQETVKLYYASALGNRVSFILEMFPQIYSELKKLMWVDLLFNLSIVALATAGGGYSGGAEIGVPALAEDSALIRVIAHEMIHSWVLPVPLPGAGNEGWASLAAIKVAISMNYSEEANAERQYFDKAFRQADPNCTLLDISFMPAGPPDNQPYMGKFMWVIESLENLYGADFMGRFMESERTAGNIHSTMDDMVFYMSLVADNDLYQWFREIGTTVGRANFELSHSAARDGVVYTVWTLSNSSITAFNFNQAQDKISFNLSGPSGTAGYCNITIPDQLLSGPYTVQVDGLPPNFTTEASNATHNFLYFNYNHSTHSVEVTSMQTHLITDLNKDGIVNILDITVVAAAYNSKPGDPKWNELADLDKNGTINILDVTMVAKDYGKTI